MSVMRLTKGFEPEAFGSALESWGWIGVGAKVPVLASLFGDVILQDATGYWYLDTLEGSLSRTWATQGAIQSALASEEGQDRYLLAGLASAAHDAGMALAAADVYSFTVPPVLGGQIELANVEVADFVVAVNIAGQLHQQVKDLPPGSKISGFTFGGG